MRQGPFRVIACLAVELVSGSAYCPPQQPATPAKPDRSKEAFIFESFHTSVRFEKDGTGTTETTAVVLLQSEAAVQQFGLLTLPYNSANEELRVDYVRARKRDGSIVVTPTENIVDMPSDITRVAPVYSDLHEKHIAVRGLAPGDHLEYRSRNHLKVPLVPNQFWFAYTFFTAGTMLDEQLDVDIPEQVLATVKSGSIEPRVGSEGGRRIYTWKSSHEGDKPEEAESLGELPPAPVQITTFRSWQEVGRWWGELEEGRATVTPEIRAKADELTKDAKTDEEKIRRIYKYVSTQFRYISLSFGIGRYQPHSAVDVLNNAYGDCKDKHTLLEALLKAVGIEADPALISATHQLDPEMPSPAQFDHVISVIPHGDQAVWLDTTEEVAPYGFLLVNLRDKQALVVPQRKGATLVTTPADPPFPMTDHFEIAGKLSLDGVLDARLTRVVRGDVEVILRAALRSVPQNKWKDLLQALSYQSGYAGEVSDVSVSPPDDTDKPLEYSYHYHRTDYPDWADRRITVPLPPFALQELKDDSKDATKPVKLGKVEGTLESHIELPRGLAPRLLPPVESIQDFAEYHSSYAFKDGVLTADRKLTLKVNELPASRRKDYQTFQKAVSDDKNMYTYIVNGTEALAAAPAPKPEAAELFGQAQQALSAMDRHAAVERLKQAVKADPSYADAWSLLGTIQLSLGQTDAAFGDFKQAITADPAKVRNYQVLSFYLLRLKREQEAIDLWRGLLKLDPNQKEAHAYLGFLLMQQKKYDEAAKEYEAVVRLSEPNSSLEMQLGGAYFEAGSTEKAIAAYEKAAEIDPKPLVWNNVAYAFAERKLNLSEAERLATQAVQAEEMETSRISLDSLKDSDLSLMDSLASYWDTLGWVYYHEGDYEESEKYLDAAWDLEQSRTIGEHLGHAYEALGKREAASRQLSLAQSIPAAVPLAGLPALPSPSGGLRTSAPGVYAPLGLIPTGELSKMRRVKLGKFPGIKGSAEFWVLFGPGPQVEKLKFISGDAELQKLEGAVESSKFNVVFPDTQPTQLIRRGVLFCGELGLGCDFTLFPVETTRLTD